MWWSTTCGHRPCSDWGSMTSDSRPSTPASFMPVCMQKLAPRWGQHSAGVLREAGLSEADIDGLHKRGVGHMTGVCP